MDAAHPDPFNELANPGACPACGGDMGRAGVTPGRAVYICSSCWPKVPPLDRVQLYAMHGRRDDCGSKVAKIVRALKAKAEKSARREAAHV